jgi:type I restriction enzyme, S subunit
MKRSGWITATIDSLLKTGAITGHKDGNHGSDYPRIEEFGSVGVPFLTAKSLHDGKVDIDNAPRLADERANKLRFGFVAPGDVLLSHNATVGRVAIVPNFTGRLLIGTSLTYFRVNPEKLSARYLAAYFAGRKFQDQLAAVMSFSTRNQVPITLQRRLSVIVPPPPEQHAIASVLGTLDDKIELNRRMNETLEAMAQALFKSWFVDATRNGLPEGWRDGTLGNVAENVRRTIKPDEIDPGMPYIGLEHMPKRCIALSEWGPSGELGSNKLGFKRGELLFGKLRPYFHKVGVAPIDGICSTDILVVRPIEPEWFGFVLGHVSSVELVNHTDAAATGTKMPRTNWNDIARYEVALPLKRLAADFTDRVNPLIERIISNIHESRTLAALRDALLPELLSGDIRVKTATKRPQEIPNA